MKTLILYTTTGCHLCEQAEALLQPVLAYCNQQSAGSVALQLKEISESAPLVELYGIRIPVLQMAGQEDELGWPFDQAQAYAFIQSALGN